MQIMRYFLLLLNWKVNIGARGCVQDLAILVWLVTRALRDSLEREGHLCTVQSSVLSTWQRWYWWMQSALNFHMSFFRMKKLFNKIHVWWNQQILSVMAQRSLTELSLPHKLSPAKRRGELLTWMIQNSCNSCGLFSRFHFVIMWLLQGTRCLSSQASSQNMACGKQFPFTLWLPGIYILCPLFVLTFLLPPWKCLLRVVPFVRGSQKMLTLLLSLQESSLQWCSWQLCLISWMVCKSNMQSIRCTAQVMGSHCWDPSILKTERTLIT